MKRFAFLLVPFIFLSGCDKPQNCGIEGKPACVPVPPPPAERLVCYLSTGARLESPWGTSAVVTQGGGYLNRHGSRMFTLEHGGACTVEYGQPQE